MNRTITFIIYTLIFCQALPSNAEVKFKLSGRNMPDKDDGNNESDCFVVLTMGGSEIGRTSPVANTANPNWPNVWTISSGHTVHVEVRDEDPSNADDHLGNANIPMADLHCMRNGETKTYNLDSSGYLVATRIAA